MAIVINGSGTVTGLAVGGLPDDSVDAGSLANSINSEITANTAKTGITSAQATAITAALPKAGGTMTGALTVNAGINVDNFNINGTTIGLSSGNMELDSGHEIWLDSNDGNFRIKKAGTDIGMIQTTNNDLILRSMVSNEDMLFQGNDGGSSGSHSSPYRGSGGGGIGGAGTQGGTSAGTGGAGLNSSITGSAVGLSGGGGGGVQAAYGASASASHGGGAGHTAVPVDGTANTGGGGGGRGQPHAEGGSPNKGGNGGSGLVIIRYRFQA